MPGELDQRGERAWPAQLRFIAAVDQLQRLGEKFDLANAAVAELEVARFFVAGEQLILDAHLHMAQFVDSGVVEITAVDERFHFFEKARAEPDVSRDRPRLDQSRALP